MEELAGCRWWLTDGQRGLSALLTVGWVASTIASHANLYMVTWCDSWCPSESESKEENERMYLRWKTGLLEPHLQSSAPSWLPHLCTAPSHILESGTACWCENHEGGAVGDHLR